MDPTYTNKVDIWAFGCIMYEMCTGKKAFATDYEAKNFDPSTNKRIVFVDPPEYTSWRVITLASQIENWIFEILKENPEERPSAEGIRRKTERAFNGAMEGLIHGSGDIKKTQGSASNDKDL
jgi:serine/threonine protein kinase